jgi:hypothetical protein
MEAGSENERMKARSVTSLNVSLPSPKGMRRDAEIAEFGLGKFKGSSPCGSGEYG